MSDKYTILGAYNDNDRESEAWDEKKVYESLGDDRLDASDYYWADIEHGPDHKVVIWKKKDGETVRRMDVFKPPPKSEACINDYKKFIERFVSNTHTIASLKKDTRTMVNVYNYWHEEIEGDLLSIFERFDDDTEESDYRYEQSRDDRDYEQRARRKNDE